MKYIPVSSPLFDGNEQKYLNEAIESGWVGSDGPFVERFEEEFAHYVGREYAVACSSGTAAIDLAVESLNLGYGDEVIVPALTIISSVLQLVRVGAVPVLVDCDPQTFNMDVAQIEAKITPRTRAIMMVHLYGLPTDIYSVLDIANKHGLSVIEDAAQAIGLKYKDRLCGSFGDVSTFSFYSNKLIACGEGGMLVTDYPDIARQARSLRNLCFGDTQRFRHDRLGWNYRMGNLQAAVGVAQLESANRHSLMKRRIGLDLHEAIGARPYFQKPLLDTPYAPYAANGFWCYPIVLPSGVRAETFIIKLHECAIGARPFFVPMNQQPALAGAVRGSYTDLHHAAFLSVHGLYLPSGITLTSEDIDRIAGAVKEL
jgi:perosamine synthetase